MIKYDAITPAQLTASAVAYVTAGANEKILIKSLVVCNDDTVARTVTVNIIPSGGAASATNQVIKALSIAAAESFDLIGIIGVQTLLGGGELEALADVAAKVSIQGSLVKIT